jgi:hypothetical protein
MARIGFSLRALAIETCLLIADTHIALGDYFDPDLEPWPEGDPTEAVIDELIDALPPFDFDTADRVLECAALLRDGWSPGDPVVLLNPSARQEPPCSPRSLPSASPCSTTPTPTATTATP